MHFKNFFRCHFLTSLRKFTFFKFFQKKACIFLSVCYNNDVASDRDETSNADWCNGSTADSDSVSRGSSPLSVVQESESFRFLFYRSVAQLGRALRSGRRGRRFKSCHSDSPISMGDFFISNIAILT